VSRLNIVFSDEFRKDYRKIKDKTTRLRIIKILKALANNPEKGKPLSNILHGKRTVRVKPFRLVYKIEKNELVVLCFDHRDKVYD